MSHNFTNGKWSDPEVPKRDWYCIRGYDRGRDNLEPCDMCESASVRYVHVMRHDAYPNSLDVGCICAGNMEQDAESAKRREATVRNRSKRRAKWPLRKWRVSLNGNPTLRVSGCFVTVFRRGVRWGWLIVRRADDQKRFSTELYATEAVAKLATFDALEKICEEVPLRAPRNAERSRPRRQEAHSRSEGESSFFGSGESADDDDANPY